MQHLRLLSILFIAAIVLASTGMALMEAEATEDPGPIKFNWAFVGYSKGDSSAELIHIDGDISLKSGDKFKFYFEMMQKGYVYLIMLSSQSEIFLFYPRDLKQYESPPRPTGAMFIPAGTDWFQLDDQIGKERFYLLVSKNRLTGLEALLNNYSAAAAKDKPALSKAVVKKIRKLRWEHRQFKQDAERPGLMMGRTRGFDTATMPDAAAVSDLAKAYVADTFFSRTFTIDHK